MRIEWIERDGLCCIRIAEELIGICGTPIRDGEPFVDLRGVDLSTVAELPPDHMACSRCGVALNVLRTGVHA